MDLSEAEMTEAMRIMQAFSSSVAQVVDTLQRLSRAFSGLAGSLSDFGAHDRRPFAHQPWAPRRRQRRPCRR